MSGKQVVGTLLGAVVGWVGSGFNPAGAWTGAKWGYAAGTLLTTPPDVEGPRAGDNNVQVSTYGAPIPIVYGSVALSDNVIWSSGIREYKSTSEQGKGGGQKVTTFTYLASWAVGLCEGEIDGIRRVWFDADLVYDADSTDAAAIAASTAFLDSMAIYLGGETQDPDPTIEAAVTTADCPAYRGLAYLVFTDIQLNEFGNRIPNVRVELYRCVSNNKISPITAAPDTLLSGPSIGQWNFSGGWHALPECSTGLEYSSGDGIVGGWFDTAQEALDAIAAVGGYENCASATPMCWSYEVYNSGATGYFNPTLVSYDDPDDGIVMRPATHPDAHLLRIWYSYFGSVAVETMGALASTPCDGSYWQGYYNTPPVPMIGTTTCTPTPGGFILGYATGCGAVCAGGTYKSDDLGAPIINLLVRRKIGCRTGQTISAMDVKRYPVLLASSGSPSNPSITGYPQESSLLYEGDAGYVGETFPAPVYADWLTAQGGTMSSGVYDNPASGNVVVNSACEITYPCTGEWKLVDGVPVCMTYTSADTAACTSSAVDLGAIVADLCSRMGVAYDATQLVGTTVFGYLIDRPMAARAAIEPLQRAYFFDAVEADGYVGFIPRGQAIVASYDDDDLGASESAGQTPRLSVMRAQESELPRKINIGHMDPDRDYESGVQSASRLTGNALSESTLNFPLVLDVDDAAQIAEISLINTWIGRETLEFTLPYSEIARNPADVVTLSVDGETWRARLAQIDYSLPGLLKCRAVVESSTAYTSTATGNSGGGFVPSTPPALNDDITGHWLDIPLLSDSHAFSGVYLAASTAGAWSGCVLLVSLDAGETYPESTTIELGTVGTVLSVLPSASTTQIDRTNVARVSLLRGDQTLSSISAASALSHVTNMVLLGDEIICFETATLVTPGVYDLSILHRGLRGTDTAMDDHAAAERFVLLDSNVSRIAIPDSRIGLPYHVKFVQIGALAADITPQVVSYTAATDAPYSPAHLAATDNGDGTYDVTWVRRGRIDGEWRDYVDVPLSETSEQYTVAVFSGATELSRATVTTQSATVTATTGNIVSVSQLSAKTGPGYESRITL
ncbi:MAG: phage tail protein [Georgfuchsia sp.]